MRTFFLAISGLIFFLIVCRSDVYGQKIQGKLYFTPGKTLNIQVDLKSIVTQQAMNNAISFEVDGTALFNYKVLNSTGHNTTLQHKGQNIRFQFSGMGQKHSFNSDDSSDLAGPFGDPIKNILSKKYEMTIDSLGQVEAVNPKETGSVVTDDRTAIVLNMLKDISDMVIPPHEGQASFFMILPNNGVGIGESWADSSQNANGSLKTIYTLSGSTDSTLIIDFKSYSTLIAKAKLAGNEATTTLNGNGAGKIIVDRATGIIKEKISITEAGGTMEAMGGTTPVNSKTTVVIHLKSP